jgi:hypothetical protein
LEDLTMTIIKLAAVALTLACALASTGAAVGSDGHTPREEWGEAPTTVTDTAIPYFQVDLTYCTPMATTPRAPTGDAAIVYAEVLIDRYGGNCDAFHAREILPRLFLSPEHS